MVDYVVALGLGYIEYPHAGAYCEVMGKELLAEGALFFCQGCVKKSKKFLKCVFWVIFLIFCLF